MYSDKRFYPTIADVCCVANVGFAINNGAHTLKDKMYEVATHLHVARNNKC